MATPELAARLTEDPSSLSDVPLIPDERWRSWFSLAGWREPRVSFLPTEYPSQDVVAIAALRGEGIGLLAPRLFQEELGNGALIAPFPYKLEGPPFHWMLWHPQRPPESFIAWMKEAIVSS